VNGTSASDNRRRRHWRVRGATTTVQVGDVQDGECAGGRGSAGRGSGLGDDTIKRDGQRRSASLTVDGGLPTASDTVTVATGSNAVVAVTYGTDPSTGVIADNVAGNVLVCRHRAHRPDRLGRNNQPDDQRHERQRRDQSERQQFDVNNGADVTFATYPTLTLNGNAAAT